MPLPAKRLVRVGKANSQTIGDWKEGVSLERDGATTIDNLQLHVATGRWHLAQEMYSQGDTSRRRRPPLYRTAISRYYYSMYHALRAASYIYCKGDDYEAHAALPSHLPRDFPRSAYWGNELKSARDYRNSADYDPYPNIAAHWAPIAQQLESLAKQLLVEVKTYLQSKGCAL